MSESHAYEHEGLLHNGQILYKIVLLKKVQSYLQINLMILFLLVQLMDERGKTSFTPFRATGSYAFKAIPYSKHCFL